MADLNPFPTIPDLKDGDWIDLDELGDNALRTYVKYPGIAVGRHVIWPNWLGCGALGETADHINARVDVTEGGGYTVERGMPVDIPSYVLAMLNQGWAFLSYSVANINDPNIRGPESRRKFCYVGKRPARLETLPVAQIKESHGLALDPDAIGNAGATAVVPPYGAMSVGDRVTFTWQGYYAGTPEFPHSETIILTAEHLGQPLKFMVPQIEVIIIEGGHADVSYSIRYANGVGDPGESERQTLRIEKPDSVRLPAIEINDYSGGPINPGYYPDGLTLRIDPSYAGIQQGDWLIVYWTGSRADRSVIKSLRIDRSILDRGLIELHVESQWLLANNGARVALSYQYARAGTAESSESLSLDISKPLNLPAPSVENATASGALRGDLLADIYGAYVNVPSEAETGSGKVEMHWFGHPNSGQHIAPSPVGGTGRRYFIPHTAIAANMSDSESARFTVFYRVTQPGQEKGEDSIKFNLLIKPLPKERYPDTQCSQAKGTETLRLVNVPAAGAELTVGRWPFKAVGQLLKIVARGTKAAGGGSTSIIVRNALPVTPAEFISDPIKANLPKSFLQTLRLNENFTLEASVSFDGGETYWPFKDGNLKLTT
ncbi:hypothetical protein [Pseudomonas sp. IT-P176]|uniref:hypothetical protein n=1 Tax=Pseudomonas sp. IT-P176 TaxID=3026444 RepID=UPI0039E01697